MNKQFFLLLVFISSISYASDQYTVRIPGAKSADLDASYNYAVGLLELAFSRSAKGKNIAIEQGPDMGQARALNQIQQGELIDVFWAGTSIEREKQLKAIRIPLLKGLLGYRMGLMHRDMLDTFAQIKSEKELLQLYPCQGADWPDSDILEFGGFTVIKNNQYKKMFNQVITKRCHFLPLGVYEVEPELEANKSEFPQLRIYKNLIIHYPFPMYFFVNKDNTKLAKLITSGLEAAIDDGAFDRYIEKSEVTKHLFPVDAWMKAKYLYLENPLLPADTDTSNPRYWIQFEGTSISAINEF